MTLWGNSATPIILASKSPRRRQILELSGITFSIMIADLDEITVARDINRDYITESVFFKAERLCTELAKKKAGLIHLAHPNSIVIGADTVVVTPDRILGQPNSLAEAREMLIHLSGKTHDVYTGVAIESKMGSCLFCEKTQVTFCPLDEDQLYYIDRYLQTGSPIDKAGAYGIQDLGAVLIDSIDGDYYNVMGLPLSRVCRELRRINKLFITDPNVCSTESAQEEKICPDSF
ncbi:MAG: septum formation protein Maf [Clostridiaceae bacterium]|nr:septum formation protein Maf [Clostridiaceae bacterium]